MKTQPIGAGGGGGEWKCAASAGTCPAGNQAAMPGDQTKVDGLS
jgi:hypothetical protein